ncbi:Ldh family oxidoreductase [Serratia ureilytica]
MAAKLSMDRAIEMARTAWRWWACAHRPQRALSYFVQQAARAGMVGISLCQSDRWWCRTAAPRSYGTQPIAFSRAGRRRRADHLRYGHHRAGWGKVLDARSRSAAIPDTWAVDAEGKHTTDPFAVSGLLPIAGPSYGLMMMVDVLSGILLGLPFSKHVSSMYHDLSAGRGGHCISSTERIISPTNLHSVKISARS